MRLLICLFFLLLILGYSSSTSSLYASTAHCSPNAITTATVYTNYQTAEDTFIAFTYNIDSTCYPNSDSQEISFALVETTELYGANALDVKDAMAPNVATARYNIWGPNWMSVAFVGTEVSDWTSFYFDLRLARSGNPGLLEILLVQSKVGAGISGGPDDYEPVDSPVLLGRGAYDAARLPAVVPEIVRIHFDSGPTLEAGTNNYALILRAPNGNASDYVTWEVETGTLNIGAQSANSGLTWDFIAGGVTPHITWYGRTLTTGATQFALTDILLEYLPVELQSGQSSGGVYWPADITPTAGHDTAIPDYALVVLNKTASPTQPDAVYNLSDACQIVRTEVLVGGFRLQPLTDFLDQSDDAAEGIPILELFMGEGNSLSRNIGLDATSAFLLLGIFFSLITMTIVARIFPNYILVLLSGLLPIIVLTMSNFLPELVLLTTGLFVVLYITWRTMIKADV